MVVILHFNASPPNQDSRTLRIGLRYGIVADSSSAFLVLPAEELLPRDMGYFKRCM